METGRFSPSAALGPEMLKFAINFCYCVVDEEKAVFQWKRAVSGPSGFFVPEMVKSASNFCYCAVDQEKAVFQWKRAVSGPAALLGPEMIKFASNFCCCAVDQEKAVFQRKRAVSPISHCLGPEKSPKALARHLEALAQAPGRPLGPWEASGRPLEELEEKQSKTPLHRVQESRHQPGGARGPGAPPESPENSVSVLNASRLGARACAGLRVST